MRLMFPLAGVVMCVMGLMFADASSKLRAEAERTEKLVSEPVKADPLKPVAIVCRSLTVVGEDGKPAITMGQFGDTAGVWVSHPNGKGMISIYAGKTGEATVGLYKDWQKDAGCRFAVTLDHKTGDPYFQAIDSAGKIYHASVEPPKKDPK